MIETVGAGARSQSASTICSGGVSAVMGSSEFRALTFHPRSGLWHRSNRSLLFKANQPIVRTACPDSDTGRGVLVEAIRMLLRMRA